MTSLTVTQARAALPRLIDRAQAGEEITVTRHGVPVARIVPARDELRPEARILLERARAVSLSEADLAALDAETLSGRYPTRSAAVQAALRLLRESRLADAYVEAFSEWDESEDRALWEKTGSDPGGSAS